MATLDVITGWFRVDRNRMVEISRSRSFVTDEEVSSWRSKRDAAVKFMCSMEAKSNVETKAQRAVRKPPQNEV